MLAGLVSGRGAFARQLIAGTMVLFILAACANRPEETAEIRTLVPMEAIDIAQGPQLPVGVNGIRPGGEDGIQTVVAFSAGGADGAFGAGILSGWTAHGSRPEFDVVTGVSTGALLAVLAFLGPDYDRLIERLYTSQTNEKIFRNQGLGGVFGDSLYDNTPLKKQIEDIVTQGLLDKVAEEHRKGRRLYVVTTNLDAGSEVIWDMGKIAQGGRTNTLLHFQKVLRASAAVPGYFKPVYIKPQRGVQLRQAHVDGGVKEPVLFSPFMVDVPARKKQLFLIINGSTAQHNAHRPVEPKLSEIARKTITELIRELQEDTIFRHYTTAKNAGAEFNVVSIPDSIPIAQESLNFDQERMKKLFKAGYDIGASGKWRTMPRSIHERDRQIAAAVTE